ncbi:SURF1 family cytochrome oxidase biogenesis protein [Curtobacterium sp. MCSS17_016]|uniref:SURF1 family cytochrome oxidase biogenesis protein n=1 Tax=Curtobacterium sp. MCSS17_016 TaxID=2175644 RepID=UPI000DA88991|nr:SURF1 family cytochrome oxidase biogenesis protein [Curtobacterium sp. MCSS17_016]WIE78702.1 SURF1 family cytochrome oxidase biogenesis protein [Curtobacterium sp. MCSS17_016]
MWAVARRPRWIALLLLALVLAAVFAGLGKWQLERSIANGKPLPATTETRRTLEAVTTPERPVSESLAGQKVTVTGTFVADDTTVLTGRTGGGKYQTVGHLVDSDGGASLPVVIGWSDQRSAAVAGGERLADGQTLTIQGRYYPAESPDQDAYKKGEYSAVAPARFVNTWQAFDDRMYLGYVVADGTTAKAADLGTIADRAPSREVQFDWLNLFYAIEWVVFAGFAVFLWYRFVKDAWEREQEEEREAALATEADSLRR